MFFVLQSIPLLSFSSSFPLLPPPPSSLSLPPPPFPHTVSGSISVRRCLHLWWASLQHGPAIGTPSQLPLSVPQVIWHSHAGERTTASTHKKLYCNAGKYCDSPLWWRHTQYITADVTMKSLLLLIEWMCTLKPLEWPPLRTQVLSCIHLGWLASTLPSLPRTWLYFIWLHQKMWGCPFPLIITERGCIQYLHVLVFR